MMNEIHEWQKLCDEYEDIFWERKLTPEHIKLGDKWIQVKAVGDAMEKRIAELEVKLRELHDKFEKYELEWFEASEALSRKQQEHQAHAVYYIKRSEALEKENKQLRLDYESTIVERVALKQSISEVWEHAPLLINIIDFSVGDGYSGEHYDVLMKIKKTLEVLRE